MALCNVAHEFVEYISTIVMKYILKKGLTPANLTYLIKLLEGKLCWKLICILNLKFYCRSTVSRT